MKKTLIALAALSAIAGVAQAQSSVTLYGLVDADVGRFTTNVGSAGAVKSQSQTKVNPEGLNGNRWGMRGSEDLGGGMKAIFNLESGFTIDDGAQGQGALFGRRANVGLAGDFGTVELGRSSSPYSGVAADHTMMGMSKFDPSNLNNGLGVDKAAALSTVTAASAQPFLARTTTWLGYQERVNNSIKYTSPNMSGFTAAVMYGLGEDASATTSASKTVSASVKYANGPMLVSAGYQSEGVSTTAPVIAVAAPLSTSSALTNTLLSATYDFGVAKAGLGLNRAVYKNVFAGANTDMAAQNEYSLSVAVPMGATTLSAAYSASSGDDLGKSTGFGVQAVYALSKRTTLYAGAVSTSAYDKLADAVKLAAPTSDIQRNTTYAAGVRHTF
jgi:predicted porin